MKCQKCARPAVVHLTEILTHSDAKGDSKRAVEIHLCLAHAVEAGLLTAATDSTGVTATAQAQLAADSSSTPVKSKSKAVAVAPKPAAPYEPGCPICGMSWSEFKQGGVMGCTHDYEQYSGKLMPLLKRAHEGATEHAGKIPARQKVADVDRQKAAARLQRDLQKAVDAENYETAAKLRDQLKSFQQN